MTIHKAILDPSELLVFSVMTTGATKALFLSERQADTLKLLAPLTRQARDLYNRSGQQYPIALPTLRLVRQSATHGAG